MSSRNFFSGRTHLQDSIFLRYSFSPVESVITLEDLKCPQVESDTQQVCGRIDFSGFEPEQLLKQWDDIVCANYNSEEILQLLSPDCRESSNGSDKVMSFTLLPPSYALQQFPYSTENRTVCGIETIQVIKVELESGTLRFIRERYAEDLLDETAAIGAASEEKSPHVHCRAIIILDQNRGMKRLDSLIRLIIQTRNFLFPSFNRLCCHEKFQ
jgi:hypothetical protein